MILKYEDFGKYLSVALFLVSLCLAFGLGRLSLLPESTPVSIYIPQGTIQNAALGNLLDHSVLTSTRGGEGATIVASRNGSKYHRTDCSGAKQIKDENKVYFNTVEAARAAGYSPAANCPGLE